MSGIYEDPESPEQMQARRDDMKHWREVQMQDEIRAGIQAADAEDDRAGMWLTLLGGTIGAGCGIFLLLTVVVLLLTLVWAIKELLERIAG